MKTLGHFFEPLYVLEGEHKLKFSMLYTTDSNDSIKQIEQREAPEPTTTQGPMLGKNSKSIDTQEVDTGLYLSNAQVDKWSEQMLKGLFPSYNEHVEDKNPCAECWRNIKSKLTSKMWGVFAGMGIYLALCCHGFMLLLADMACSGEL